MDIFGFDIVIIITIIIVIIIIIVILIIILYHKLKIFVNIFLKGKTYQMLMKNFQ